RSRAYEASRGRVGRLDRGRTRAWDRGHEGSFAPIRALHDARTGAASMDIEASWWRVRGGHRGTWMPRRRRVEDSKAEDGGDEGRRGRGRGIAVEPFEPHDRTHGTARERDRRRSHEGSGTGVRALDRGLERAARCAHVASKHGDRGFMSANE